MSTTPSISLNNANKKFSEIAWTYTDITNSDISELALIAVSDNDDNSLISKKILSPTQTSLNLIELIDLTVESNICIEVTVTTGITYSSNVLRIPKRLSKPTIYNPEASSSLPYKIVTKNQAVDFFIYDVDVLGYAESLNIILYDSILSNIIELPDINIPTTTTTNTTVNIKNIGVTCSKTVADPNIFQISLTNLINDSVYRIAVYVTNKYTNNATSPLSNIENESLVSNTVMYVEPNTGPQMPTLKSVSFDITNPYYYTFEIMTPANSYSFTTTEIAVYFSKTSNFTTFTKVPLNIDALANPILSSSLLNLSVNLTGKITPGNTYFYKVVVSNSDSDSETLGGVSVISTATPKTNLLSLMACSTPSVSDGLIYISIYPSTFNIVWPSISPNTGSNKCVDYTGSGTIQSNVTVNGTTHSNQTSAYTESSPIAGTEYNVSVAYSVVGIITKITYNGPTSNPITSSTTTTYSTNMNIGSVTPFTYFSSTIQSVSYIKANALNYSGGIYTPKNKEIDLSWTAGVNPGIVPTYFITYSTDAGFANPTTVSTTGITHTLSNLINGTKYYIKIVTKYINAPVELKYSKIENSTTVYPVDSASDDVLLKDSAGNMIGVAPFDNVVTPSNFSLESSKNTVRSTWNIVTNPLASAGAPSSSSKTPVIKYGIAINASAPTIISSNTNTYGSLNDGTPVTISLYSVLQDIYSYYELGMNFANTNTIEIKSSIVIGNATPFDGPDIILASYSPATNIMKLTINLNGTEPADTSLLIMGIVSNGTSGSTFSYSSLLNSSNFTLGGSLNNEYSLSLTNTTPAIESSSTVQQYIAITNSTAGISYSTFGFSTNYALNADTNNKVTRQIN
jgi:hypothetical protein